MANDGVAARRFTDFNSDPSAEDLDEGVIRARKLAYVATVVVLFFVFLVSRDATWQGSKELHTVMEVVATLLALLAGVMALVRFYSKKNSTILMLGAAFLGTAMLDGYHALVTSTAFAPYLPSALPDLIPWSWLASRFYLGLLLSLSWVAWWWEEKPGAQHVIRESHVYIFVGFLTLASFLFFALVPMPRGYFPESGLGRPEELVPAALFMFALIGYLKKGAWRYDALEHWLVLSLIVGVMSQTVFMPFSFGLFDFGFDTAHTLKKITYVCMLIGLLISMYSTFKRAERSADEFRRAEQLAQKDQERLQIIFETVPDGIITTNEIGTLHAFNPGAEKMFGYSAEEVIGKNVKMLMPSEFSENHDGYMAKYSRAGGASAIGQRREIQGLHKDGAVFEMDLTINESATSTGDRRITGILRDITELRQTANRLAKTNSELEQLASEFRNAERIARKNEERLQIIFETVPDGIITTDETGMLHAFNPGAEQMFGYKSEEVIGKNVKMLMPKEFSENHDGYMAKYSGAEGASAIGQRREIQGLHKDGAVFEMDLTINESATSTGDRRITGILRDITELRQTANHLAKINSELEQFAYAASHDLKAPLRGIDSLAGFIREDLGDGLDEDILKNFSLLQNRIHRMERLLDDLLSYSRAGRVDYEIEEISPHELLDDVVTLIAPPDGFEIEISGTTGLIKASRAPLQQVLMNVIGNGIKHHDKSVGKIEVNVSETPQFVIFVIEDDGPGIPQEFHDRIFKMFHTLKRRDELESSGMGLAMVKKIVESVSGSIDIWSMDGSRGTSFSITWPKIMSETGITDKAGAAA